MDWGDELRQGDRATNQRSSNAKIAIATTKISNITRRRSMTSQQITAALIVLALVFELFVIAYAWFWNRWATPDNPYDGEQEEGL